MSKVFSRIFHNEQAGLLLALVLLCLVISLLTPVFFTAINIKNVLRDASLVAIAGMGMDDVIHQLFDRIADAYRQEVEVDAAPWVFVP